MTLCKDYSTKVHGASPAVMVTIVAEHIGRLFISLQHIRQVPRMLTEAAPSMPATLRDCDVPAQLRDRNITSGYRQLHQNWRYYFLSLFQRHNETLNVWTHLVAFLIILVKACDLAENVDLVNDQHAWPLCVLLLSSLTYTAFSVIAHLFGSKSEFSHFVFYYMDYVGVAQYQYGSAVVHFYYAIDAGMHGYLHASYLDYVGRREVYASLHGSGESAFFVQLYAGTVMACVVTGAIVLTKVNHTLVKHKCA
uniref:Uncharacterized protein n=1 Tax=Knipowitschia caucasica TaxID=637954 RepID=A0AAV2K9S2_KNICA